MLNPRPYLVLVYWYKLRGLTSVIRWCSAFMIKMPTLHRLAVFRDDLVFVFLLYQRWIYPIDKKRANEFGCVLDPNAFL